MSNKTKSAIKKASRRAKILFDSEKWEWGAIVGVPSERQIKDVYLQLYRDVKARKKRDEDYRAETGRLRVDWLYDLKCYEFSIVLADTI